MLNLLSKLSYAFSFINCIRTRGPRRDNPRVHITPVVEEIPLSSDTSHSTNNEETTLDITYLVSSENFNATEVDHTDHPTDSYSEKRLVSSRSCHFFFGPDRITPDDSQDNSPTIR